MANQSETIRKADNPQFWKECYRENVTPWQLNEPHPALVKYYDKLMGSQDAKRVVFVPFCGKTVDMKWLWDRGHTVIGIDLSGEALEQFYQENNIEYKKIPQDKWTLYESLDGRIKLYEGNLYDLAEEGEHLGIESVWDRGALTTQNAANRRKYSQSMRKLCHGKSIRYLLVVDNYEVIGPEPDMSPYSVDEHEIRDEYFPKSEGWTVVKLESRPFWAPELLGEWLKANIQNAKNEFYFIEKQ